MKRIVPPFTRACEARHLRPGDLLVGMGEGLWPTPWLVVSVREEDVSFPNIHNKKRVVKTYILHTDDNDLEFYEWPVWPDTVMRIM